MIAQNVIVSTFYIPDGFNVLSNQPTSEAGLPIIFIVTLNQLIIDQYMK